MADKYPPPQYPQNTYGNNPGYASPPPQGQMMYGDPNQQNYDPNRGYYPPPGQPQYGPPQQGGYYPPQQQPMYVEERKSGGGPGICAGLFAGLACCCCLDCLF